MHPKYFLMKTPFAIILLVLVVASLGAVIGLFVKANEHAKDLTLEKYYEFTHYAILSLTVFIGSIVWYFTYCSEKLYGRWSVFGYNNNVNHPYSCGGSKESSSKEDDSRSANVKRVTLIGAIVFLLGSIVAYVTTVEIKSDREEYHKRCTVGSVLLLLSVCTFLFDKVYIWYKKLSGCTEKRAVEVVSGEAQPTQLTYAEQMRVDAQQNAQRLALIHETTNPIRKQQLIHENQRLLHNQLQIERLKQQERERLR
jgi:uncharacterized membrane protein